MTGQAAWPNDVLTAIRRFELGDIIDGVEFVFYGAEDGYLPLDFLPQQESGEASAAETTGEPEDVPARTFALVFWDPPNCDGLAIITTQTCDCPAPRSRVDR